MLAGEKVATSSLLAQYEGEKDPLPAVGERRVMIGSSAEELAVVEVRRYRLSSLAMRMSA